MQNDRLEALLAKARLVLDRHMFEADGTIRDDVAAVCMDIDDALPAPHRSDAETAGLDRDRVSHSEAA